MPKGKRISYIGMRSGRLLVIGEKKADPQNKSYHKIAICKCDCGRIVEVRATHIATKRVKSCGCLRIEKNTIRLTKHGLYGTRLYRIWSGIKRRCFDKNDPGYARYGKRGITMCDEWKNDFMSFYNWAIANGYKDNLTIDRINNNGNYELENCRWANKKTQSRNTRKNKLLFYNNKVYCLTEWAEILHIHPETIRSRLNRGLTVKEALEYKRGRV